MKKTALSTAVILGGIYLGSTLMVPPPENVEIDDGTVHVSALLADESRSESGKNAFAIVQGEVTEVRPSALGTNQPGQPVVYTDYVISVSKVIKGDVAETVIVRQIGGTVGEGKDRLSFVYDDGAELVVGEKSLFLLGKMNPVYFDMPEGTYVIYGGKSGKYELAGEFALSERGTEKLSDVIGELVSEKKSN